MTERKKYATHGAMRTALEERINRTARETGRDVQRLRRQVAFDRLLARFFADNQYGSFVLKGGYAIELRLHGARTTKDIDLCINGIGEIKAGDRELLKIVRRVAATDTGDVWLDTHEELTGNEWMDFAGIPAPRISAISTEQQFSEKIHSYTLPRQTPDSRTKDLIDLVLLIENCSLDKKRLRDAIERTFEQRKTHKIPEDLDNPPENWRERFKKMAKECGMPDDIDAAIVKIREYYRSLFEEN
jgi:predicted nucleotidyltransferase component of viral defense system